MARIPRLVVPGLPHHVTQRGNRRMTVFFTDADYILYIDLLHEWAAKAQVQILAYCLMPNHVHVIAVPHLANSLHLAFRETHRRYSLSINKRNGWTGYLWQGRFSSFTMDAPYTAAAIRYVENNPVKAGLVHAPARWPWSSAAERHPDANPFPRQAATNADTPPLQDEIIEKHARTGRPLGSESFVAKLELECKRVLTRQKPGPKPGRQKRGKEANEPPAAPKAST